MRPVILFLLAFVPAVVHADPESAIAEPKISIVNGQESYIQELNMGPEQTEFWKRIQILTDEPDLMNFPRISEILKLDLKEPLDYIDIPTARPKFRKDIKSKDWFIASGHYGVGISSNEQRQRFLSLEIYFDLSRICITKDEIVRRYVHVFPILPFGNSGPYGRNVVGVRHSIKLVGRHGGFDIAQSGCAARLGFTKYITE